ncbi:Pentatricopeptide repeat superfamily protein, putative isoform 1 [Hibiscus syriacus]|uniref:Pentatricopeptide repeat superfamily protein, putative isoform 1 n=1 Tax=Hibiscus syriacus TaxID=106335 RepID=A0A6A2XJR0_HIBSY|nr:Pentatricopeptide repeat superfamily protein, putative isoform 1 [Hibiscus syriacus]
MGPFRDISFSFLNLSAMDFMAPKKKDHTVVVECRGHDAARFHNINHAHGWEQDVVDMVEQKEVKNKISILFVCDTLKSDKTAEEHIKQFMAILSGIDAVVNIGPMSISGMDFETDIA